MSAALGVHVDTLDAWLQLAEDACTTEVLAALSAFQEEAGGVRPASFTASAGIVVGPHGSSIADAELKVGRPFPPSSLYDAFVAHIPCTSLVLRSSRTSHMVLCLLYKLLSLDSFVGRMSVPCKTRAGARRAKQAWFCVCCRV